MQTYLSPFWFFQGGTAFAHPRTNWYVRTHLSSMQILPRGTTLCSVKPTKQAITRLQSFTPNIHWTGQDDGIYHCIPLSSGLIPDFIVFASPTNHFVLTMCFCLFACLYSIEDLCVVNTQSELEVIFKMVEPTRDYYLVFDYTLFSDTLLTDGSSANGKRCFTCNFLSSLVVDKS